MQVKLILELILNIIKIVWISIRDVVLLILSIILILLLIPTFILGIIIRFLLIGYHAGEDIIEDYYL